MSEDFQLWGSGRRTIPPRPEFPEIYPENDERHWYDLEFAGWNVRKESLPNSPGDGSAGKRIVCIHHLVGHPYMAEFDRSMLGEAERFGITLEIRHSYWDPDVESDLVDSAIRDRPDLIVLSPEGREAGTELFRRVYRAGIPLIASNLVPETEGFKYALAWTGPDDWGQFRLLSRKFAELARGEGGYCIVNHIPGSSAYFARRWATVTELAKIAPRMELLDMADTSLDTELTYRATLDWIDRFGPRLRGIICADDSLAQQGVNRAVRERSREDLVRVACGATAQGMRSIKEGELDAITYQPPELDGALPVRVAVDWFNGLSVEPIRYLPLYLIDRGNIDDFLLMSRRNPEVDLDPLSHLVAECDSRGVDRFFDGILSRFRQERIISEEFFRGFSIELLSRLAAMARAEEPLRGLLYRDPESLFKQLFQQTAPTDTILWLKALALRTMSSIGGRRSSCVPLGDRLKIYVDEHFRESLSLKTLSARFGISAAYLGKVFHESVGLSFTRYLNERRVGEAERILATRRVKAKDVALAVGYTDANYFYNVFKKITGRNPSEVQGE